MVTTVTDDSYSTPFATDLVVGQDLDFQQQGTAASVGVLGWAGSLNVGTPLSFIEQGTAGTVAPQGIAGTITVGFIVGGAVPDRAEVGVTGFAGSLQAVEQIRETPEQVALWIDASQFSATAYATTEYKLTTSGTWLTAHPMYRVDPGGANDAFAGCIFDLTEGETYDARVTVEDGGSTVFQGQVTTRSLPAAAGTPTSNVSSLSALQTAINGASPGDVIELADGTYSGTFSVDVSGTANNPIYIRGQSKTGTIINTSGRITMDTANYVVLENMTIDRGFPVNDTTQLAHAIRLAATDISPFTTTGLVFRDLIIQNSPWGICTAGGSTSPAFSNDTLVYNNVFTGTLEWSATTIPGGGFWNNDGIRLVGYGNAVWNNTITGFSDSITFAHSQDEADGTLECNYAYRNYIRNSLDNVFEFDYAQRFHAAYDNYCENINTGISQSDNVLVRNLGPTYFFRNILVNFAKRFVKLNARWDGWHHYNNTYIRTQGISGDFAENAGYIQDSPSGRNTTRWAYRNNIHVARHALTGDLLSFRVAPAGVECDVSHNAWYPDGEQMEWPDAGPTFTSATNAIAGTPSAGNDSHSVLYPSGTGLTQSTRWHQFDQISESNPWTNTLTLGARSDTEVTGGTTLGIDAASNCKNAGTPIPGITDGYSGAAPDMGAVIQGRTAVSYGAPTAPDWFLSATADQWFTVPATNTAASVGEIEFGNFTGSGFNQERLEFVDALADGHTTGWENPIVILPLGDEAPTWIRLCDSSLLADRTNGPATNTLMNAGSPGDLLYNDGVPRSAHFWNSGQWPVDGDIWFPIFNGTYANGKHGTQVMSLDRDAITSPPITAAASSSLYTYHGHGVPSGFSGFGQSALNIEAQSSARDYDTGLIWTHAQLSSTGAYPFWSVDPSDGTVTQYASFGGAFPGGGATLRRSMSFITDGHWIIISPISGTVWVQDLSNLTSSGIRQAIESGSPPYGENNALDRCGVGFNPDTRIAYVHRPANGRTLYTLQVPTDVWNGTYTWGSTTPSGSTPSGSGQYSHFQLIRDMGNGQAALLSCGDLNGGPWMVKLS